MQTETDIYDLITDYLTGEITPADNQRLQEWVASSPANVERLRIYRELWAAAYNEHYDVDAAKRRFARMAEKVDLRRTALYRQMLREQRNKIFRLVAVFAMPIVLMGIAAIMLNLTSRFNHEVVYATVDGQQSTFMLPDGTRVNMEENSRLVFSQMSFVKGIRQVRFEGDARFMVMSDSLHPFDITTPHGLVHVVGTEFNLITRADGNYATIVLDEGVVDYTNRHTQEHTRLTAGDVLTVNNQTNEQYCRTRVAHEMRMGHHRETQDLIVRRYLAEDSTRTLLVNVGRALDPGVYEMRVNATKDTVHFERVHNGNAFQTGKGTKESPYVITTPQHLCSMRDALVANQKTYFMLAADIDMFGINWIPVNDRPNAQDYWIDFNGNGHTIHNLTCTDGKTMTSFFGTLCGECRNLALINVIVAGGDSEAGALAGRLGHPSYPGVTTVRDCYITGHVGTNGYAGGLAGTSDGHVYLNAVSVTTDVVSSNNCAGGLVANVRGNLAIKYCSTGGTVTAPYAAGVLMKSRTNSKASVSINHLAMVSKSVCGEKTVYDVGNLQSTDRLYALHQFEQLSLNGRRISKGEKYEDIIKVLQSWPDVWFKCIVDPA